MWSLIIVTAVGAADAEMRLDPKLEKFVENFLLAAQLKNADRLRELSHTKSKACVKSGNAEYYDRIIDGMIRIFGHDQEVKNIDYETTDAEELDSTVARMTKRGMKWPVEPDAKIIVHFEKPTGAGVANLQVAKDQGGWRWVHVRKT